MEAFRPHLTPNRTGVHPLRGRQGALRDLQGTVAPFFLVAASVLMILPILAVAFGGIVGAYVTRTFPRRISTIGHDPHLIP